METDSANSRYSNLHLDSPKGCFLGLFAVLSFLGCNGAAGQSSQPPPATGITISVTPAAVSVLLGSPQIFSATVTNVSNTNVIWAVNGVAGGDAISGTINPSGVFTAPNGVPAPGPIVVQATSVADMTKSAAATVAIASDVAVSVAPQPVPVELGASRVMAATISSLGNPNRAVNWMVAGAGCAASACGTVDTTGTYTAPQIQVIPPNVTITAVSVADPTRTGSATIILSSIFSLSVSGPATVTAGASANFAATLVPVSGSNPSRAIAWTVSGGACTGTGCGTISSTGVYTAPTNQSTTASVQIMATPVADPSRAVSTTVGILPNVSVVVSPTAVTMPLGASQHFSASVTGATDATVTWYVGTVVGGNAVLGTISNSQTDPNHTIYTAPLVLPPGDSVSISAQSNANPTISSTVNVIFTIPISLVISPPNSMRSLGHRQTFTVQVFSTGDQRVAIYVNGIAGGNPAWGLICVTGSNPCQQISATSNDSFDFLAPIGVPSPNAVSLLLISDADTSKTAAATVTILPHISVSVSPPGSTLLPQSGRQRFKANVIGTDDQQVIWTALLRGAGCDVVDACGTITSSGLFVAPTTLPNPNLIDITATSTEDTSQSGSASVSVTLGSNISALAPASAYAEAGEGFLLDVSGAAFTASSPGPGSTIEVAGLARPTSCASAVDCTALITATDLVSAGSLSVRVLNPDGTSSNTVPFAVLAPDTSGADTIPLTAESPSASGKDITVVDLSTNGGSNAALAIAAFGPFSVATHSCILGGAPLVFVRPSSGVGTMDLCLFSFGGLDASYQFTLSGPSPPDIAITNREPVGLGIVHLTLQVPSTAIAGSRTLFIENPSKDKAAATGTSEVR
jgi:hypothetical protein